MPRSLRTGTPLHIDLEIEKTAKRLRKEAKQGLTATIFPGTITSSSSPLQRSHDHWAEILLNSPIDTDIETEEEEEEEVPEPFQLDKMADEQKPPLTLRAWGTYDIPQQPSCINLPAAANFELKPNIIPLLPTFHGLESEDPHKHLKQFHIVTMSMKPNNISDDAMKLRAFPHTLQDTAYDWFSYLEPNTIHSWTDMGRAFLKKYFPGPKASNLKQQIIGIKQGRIEKFHTYWERFKRLCSKCPQHGISPEQLVQYFCTGLSPPDRRMLESSANGSYLDKTAEQVRNLIDLLAENSMHAVDNSDWDTPRTVNQVSNSKVEEQISDLAKIVMQLVTRETKTTPPPAPVPQTLQIGCGICLSSEHPTDCCPSFQEDGEKANFVGGPSYQQQRAPGQYQAPQGYQRQGWRPAAPNANYRQAPQQQAPPQAETSTKSSLEDLVKTLAQSQQSFQQETRNNIKNLEKQMIQLSSTVNKLDARGKLPSQTEKNPREGVNAVTLRSGKQYEGPEMPSSEEIAKKEVEKEKEVATPSPIPAEVKAKTTPPPFPSRLQLSKKEREDMETMETFRKLEVNIPFLDAIKQVPRWAKFLKELCTSKNKLKGNELINMSENVSAVLQRKLPPKCKDPGVFTVPCKLGNISVSKAMLDLGASINVLPYSIFKTLGAGPLKKTGVIIQLADKSTVHPKGVLEDVLVQVNELVFPEDFYVIEMESNETSTTSSILLGHEATL